MLNDEAKAKALGRLRRIEGQVQGIQRMVEEDKYCVDILLQLSAVQGAVEQVQKLLLGQHLETCVADAVRSGARAGPPAEARRAARRLLPLLGALGRPDEPEASDAPLDPVTRHALRGLRRQGRARAPVACRG